MTFLELRVQRFRRHRRATFCFKPGFNVIVGRNEAGKSALRDALRLVLFGNPESSSHRQEATPSWGDGQPPVLELVFEVPEGRFELVKDFAAGRVLLRGGGRAWERPTQVQGAIYRAVGFRSERAFSATAHVRQAELQQIAERDVAIQLGRIVTGSDEDAARALRSLSRALEELERGLARPASNPGRLKRLETRAEELRQQVGALRRDVEEARRLQDQVVQLRQRLSQVETDLQDRIQLLEVNRQTQQAQERAEQLRREVQARKDLLDRLAGVEEQLARTRQELEQVPDVEQAVVERVEAALARAEELESQLDRLASKGEPIQVPKPRVWPWIAFAAAVVLAAWPGAAAAWRVVFATAAAAAAWAGWREWQARDRARAQAEARSRERRRWAEEMRTQAAQLRQQARRHLSEVGAASLEQLKEWASRRQKLEADLQSLHQRYRDALGDRDPEKLQDELRAYAADLHAQLAFLASDVARGKSLLPLEVQRLQREVEALHQQQVQLRDELGRLEARLETAPDGESLLRAEEELSAVREELELLQRRRRALRVALEVLEEAKAAVEVPARRAVEDRAGQFLARLTGGRYTRVQVPPGQDTLRLEVWSEEAQSWLAPEEPFLSRGTVDLVFLAARVALVDVLASSVRPPLLLDDPFVTFDPERRRRALDWLRELSQERQILLFTWDEEVASHADAVVRLPWAGGTQPVLD